jgi:tRNA-dihydrouridine synthase
MRYYLAPMEGITDSIYRRIHHKYFPGVDRYYMPFLSPTIHRTLTHKEDRELPMADSVDFVAIPQILTKVPEDFLWAAEQCAQRGYSEVNLNAGCPSGTVTAKGKGAGMLADLDSLDRFLGSVFAASPLPVSVKTRIGMESPEEFASIVKDCKFMGASILGGCCGTTPAHIAAVKANLQLPIY